MPGGVAHHVSFGFYDPPAHSAGRSFMHERLTDKVFREFKGASGYAGPVKAANITCVFLLSHLVSFLQQVEPQRGEITKPRPKVHRSQWRTEGLG
jgi:hypothetical protein